MKIIIVLNTNIDIVLSEWLREKIDFLHFK